MAGDIWEQAVEVYLATDRGLFLNPQYLIGTLGDWEACPDFLAIAFPDRKIWMVEVTKAPRGGLYGKIEAFQSQYVPRIREQMQLHRVVREDDPWAEWSVGLWIFAPEAVLPTIEARMKNADIQLALTTSLESTLVPNWESRFR